jgi:hypothetical protein
VTSRVLLQPNNRAFTCIARSLEDDWDVGEEEDLLTTMREEEASNLFQNFFGV